MGELQSALDALTVEDLHVLGADSVLDRTAFLVAARNRLDAELTRTVRHGDKTLAVEHDGLKSMRSWLIGHVRLPAPEASRIVRSGRLLEYFPALAAGVAGGPITAGAGDGGGG